MQDATEFGKVLRSLMPGKNLRQGQLAEKLGVSVGTISNFIIGKTIPEMDFLSKCIKELDVKNGTIANLIYTAFISSATGNQKKVILDTRFIDFERIKLLAKTLTVLLLYPNEPTIKLQSFSNPDKIGALDSIIDKYYKVAEKEPELNLPLVIDAIDKKL